MSDVFGIRVSGFYRTDMNVFFDKDVIQTEKDGVVRERIRIGKEMEQIITDIDYHEEVEEYAASVFAEFVDKKRSAITYNSYGKGKAYYVATESDYTILKWLLEKLPEIENSIIKIPVPYGVQVR